MRQAGIETPELDARVLLCHAAGLSHEATIARAREALRPEAAARLDAAIARRLKREPVGAHHRLPRVLWPHLPPWAATLDPRPDTETLIEAALDLVAEKGWRERPLRLLDLGTGTGCILVTLLAELPRARGLGTDLSPDALALAAANARRHGVAARAAFVAADWLDADRGQVRPHPLQPALPRRRGDRGAGGGGGGHDPRLALDGGPDGLDAYRRIAARAGEVLAEDGRLLVEIGPTQGEDVAGILEEAGLKRDDEAGAFRLDLAGRPRVVLARL